MKRLTLAVFLAWPLLAYGEGDVITIGDNTFVVFYSSVEPERAYRAAGAAAMKHCASLAKKTEVVDVKQELGNRSGVAIIFKCK